MAHRRVTIQDIADACGLSRNTVSKVFNNRGAVPEATKRTVLQKAKELGYYQLPESGMSAPVGQACNIALLTGNDPQGHSFGSLVITSFTDQISRAGYNLKMFRVSEEEAANRSLPPHLLLNETAGIIAIELFDKEYCDMLCTVGIPTVFIDTYANSGISLLNSDLVTMENYTSTALLTRHLIRCGATCFGFVGDIAHCLSFKERWMGYRTALQEAGLSSVEPCSILAKDDAPYGDTDWLLEQLRAMPRIPDAFVCANDYLAIHLMTAVKKMGLSVPNDVMITGFDGSPESSVVDPPLTTAQIPSMDLGRIAAYILLNRIQNPSRPNMRVYVNTVPLLRDSTR